ncbi:MAG: hypothetical protein R8M38_03560 [Mariprofundaceae bacterium]
MWIVLLALFPLLAWGEGVQAVDAKFDVTGDGHVDAEDWKEMASEFRISYARECMAALGEDPDVVVGGGVNRGERYFHGLEAVYGK